MPEENNTSVNTIPDQSVTPSADVSEVDRILQDPELLEKILKEQGLEDKINSNKSKFDREAISAVITIISIAVIGVFLLSPFIQFIQRVIEEGMDEYWTMKVDKDVDTLRVLNIYSTMIKTIHTIVHFAVTVMYVFCVIRIVTGWKAIRPKLASWLSRLVPMFIFLLFDVSIVLVTCIRGANEYDLTGHYYMNESIYSYILYPIAYFFCAMLLDREKIRRVLLYALVFTALPLHILALMNEWGIPIRYFIKNGVCLVFHQFNHYGYYILITLLTSAFLFVYEKKRWLKIIDLISVCVCTMILMINNTFGAYLATFSTLILFNVFIFVTTKKKKASAVEAFPSEGTATVADNTPPIAEDAVPRRRFSISGLYRKIITPGTRHSAVFILVVFLLVTFAMSFRYSNILTSAFKTVGDVGMIVTNDEAAGKAGTGRWKLWTGTAAGIAERPLTGWGVEGLLNTKKVGTPHNELLQYAAFFGIPTCLLYVAAVLLILWRVLRNQKKMSRTTMVCFFVSLGYLTSSLFGVAIYYTTPFVYIFLGLTYAEYFWNGPGIPKKKRKQQKLSGTVCHYEEVS